MSYVAAGIAVAGMIQKKKQAEEQNATIEAASKRQSNDAAAAVVVPPLSGAQGSQGQVAAPKPKAQPRQQMQLPPQGQHGASKFQRPDFTNQFNTSLTPQEQADFKIWSLEEKANNGKDWSKDMADYDVQGFFKAGERLDGRGHGVDRYKKPSHPTFSNESQYHGAPTPDGQGKYEGGQWGRNGDHDTYRPNPSMFKNKTHDPEALRKYFQESEDGNELQMW